MRFFSLFFFFNELENRNLLSFFFLFFFTDKCKSIKMTQKPSTCWVAHNRRMRWYSSPRDSSPVLWAVAIGFHLNKRARIFKLNTAPFSRFATYRNTRRNVNGLIYSTGNNVQYYSELVNTQLLKYNENDRIDVFLFVFAI